MSKVSYSYKWEEDTLIIRFKGRRAINMQLGNAVLTISLRTPPKKYAFIVTGNARARKGILPNSLSTLTGRWAFMPKRVEVVRKKIQDDFGQTHEFKYAKLDREKSFNYKDEQYSYDGALIMNADAVQSIFW